jgi:hypothetical protein
MMIELTSTMNKFSKNLAFEFIDIFYLPNCECTNGPIGLP